MQRFKTWQLFAICVVVWGTTWHAITYQLFDFSAEAGVAVRFALAGLTVLAQLALRAPQGASRTARGAGRARCKTGRLAVESGRS